MVGKYFDPLSARDVQVPGFTELLTPVNLRSSSPYLRPATVFAYPRKELEEFDAARDIIGLSPT